MRRLLTLAGAWLAAAVVATGVAWQGVNLVGRQVTDDRPASLTAAEIEAAVAAAGGDDSGRSTTSGAPSATSTTSATTAPPGPEPVTRTYDLIGGTAALRFSPSGVTVVFARPDAGYEVRSEPRDDGGWRIEFDGPGGRSRVEGWWDDGPRDRVDDDGADDDADDDVEDDGGSRGPGGDDSGGSSGPG